MGQLSIAVLGNPEVRFQGQLISVPNRKALALLIYLAVEGGTHAREKLAALFWPESAADRARASLRLMLTYLRDALPGAPHLLVERDSLAFNFDADFDLDLRTLRSAAGLARSGTPSESAALLRTAVDLYRADFLEGFGVAGAPEFDDWSSQQREAAHRQLSRVLDRLGQWRFDGGELEAALETARRWSAHDPLNEAAHRRLMLVYQALGDRSAALLAYEQCRGLLARELNAEPSPETEALADRIRTSALEPAPEAGPAAREAPAEPPLIGRADEHSALAAAFRAARRGTLQFAAIEGEPGIGKTRLAAEFLRWAGAQGAPVLRGRAYELSGGLPYQPVTDALRQAELPGEDSLPSGLWLAELSRLLPELRERFPGLPEPLVSAEAEARTRLFEAVARLGLALAASQPLVLFVDDLQWADAGSLDLLSYAAQRWAGVQARILMLVTMRSDDLAAPVDGRRPLADWLAGIGRHVALTRLPLGPLSMDDTRRLVEAWEAAGAPEGEPARAVRVDDLYAETGGQPLFILETLKSMQERQAGSLPSGVREVIRARLDRLSPAGLALATAAAVLGSPFDFEAACAAAGLTDAEGLPALDELTARGLLREVSRQVVFAHDKIRETVYAEAGEARRRVFHRRALEALESRAPRPPASELARQALAAGLAERAFGLSLAAGDDAFRLSAIHDAVRHYEQARALRSPLAPAADLQSLYSQLGRAYELNDDRRSARLVYDEMLAEARARSAPQMETAALNRLALLIAQDVRDFDAARELLRIALSTARASGDRAGEAEAEWTLAQTAHYASDTAGSLAHGERALALAREAGVAELIARSLNALAYAYDEMAQWAAMLRCADEAQALYHSLGNQAMMADSLSVKAEALIRMGKARDALPLARRARALSAEIENAWGQANAAQNIGLSLLETGDWGLALQASQAGVDAARAAGFAPLLFFNLMILGSVYRSMFALEAARAAHLEGQVVAEDLRHSFMLEWLEAELCADAAVAGRWDEAAVHLENRMASGQPIHAYAGLTCWYETEALVRTGQLERAEAEAARFEERLGGQIRYRIPLLRAREVLARARAGPGEAEACLREAAALAEQLGLPGELWAIYAELKEWRRAGELVEAIAAGIEAAPDGARLRAGFLAAEPVRRVMEAAAARPK